MLRPRSRSDGPPPTNTTGPRPFRAALLLASLFTLATANPFKSTKSNNQNNNMTEAQWRLVQELKQSDKCQAFYLSKAHGYELQKFEVVTKDGYVLSLHRLVHPEDVARGGPKLRAKKPYLLLHGLVGSSSSFLRNIDWNYKPPKATFDAYQAVDMSIKTTSYDTEVRCSAQKFKEAFEGDKTASVEKLSLKNRLLNIWPEKDFCHISELDFDGDSLLWGPEFKQAYRKFELNNQAKRHVSSSLAFTLSNFNYDVWMLNLRGNEYSREHKTLKASDPEYWKFNLDTLIEQDLPAMIERVREVTQIKREPLGLVAYSYTALHILGLLTKYPSYQESLQPVVLMAPALLISKDSHLTMKYFMKLISKALKQKEGPFPAFGHGGHVERLLCKLPVASRLCHLLETVLHGKSENISDVSKLFLDDELTSLLKREIDCGRTSLAVLQQIIENLNDSRLHPKYQAWQATRNLVLAGKAKPLRRSVMLLHSLDDDISSSEEVKKLIQSALKTMALVNQVISYPKFDHSHFLFSRANQFLVNAEIARMASLFDYMQFAKPANRHKDYTPLYTKPII